MSEGMRDWRLERREVGQEMGVAEGERVGAEAPVLRTPQRPERR